MKIYKVHFGADILNRDFYCNFARGMVLWCQTFAICRAMLYNKILPPEMLLSLHCETFFFFFFWVALVVEYFSFGITRSYCFVFLIFVTSAKNETEKTNFTSYKWENVEQEEKKNRLQTFISNKRKLITLESKGADIDSAITKRWSYFRV